MKVCVCFIVSAASMAALCGCATHVPVASQVDSRQDARVVEILNVAAAKVAVANANDKETLQVIGSLASVVGGAMAGNNMYRASGSTSARVSITYAVDGQTLYATQAGRLCEYMPGKAVVIATSPSEARVQPNASCPTLAAK